MTAGAALGIEQFDAHAALPEFGGEEQPDRASAHDDDFAIQHIRLLFFLKLDAKLNASAL
jgi:hypothetical protein